MTPRRVPFLATACVLSIGTSTQSGEAIPGARTAVISEWPAVVQIGDCSGAIIHPSLVVVPAHCLAQGYPEEVNWYSHRGARIKSAPIRHCWVHPEYPNKVPEFDIGVCSLVSPTGNSDVALIGDVKSNAKHGQPQLTKVVGYGDLRAYPRIPKVSNGRVIQMPTAFTMSVGTGRNPACFGDSGSGVYAHAESGRYALLGLISGPESGTCRGRAIAVRIQPHLDWLEATTGMKIERQFRHDKQ